MLNSSRYAPSLSAAYLQHICRDCHLPRRSPYACRPWPRSALSHEGQSMGISRQATRYAAHTDPYPRKVFVPAQLANDAPHAVVPAVAALSTQPHLRCRQIQVIVDHQQPADWNLQSYRGSSRHRKLILSRYHRHMRSLASRPTIDRCSKSASCG